MIFPPPSVPASNCLALARRPGWFHTKAGYRPGFTVITILWPCGLVSTRWSMRCARPGAAPWCPALQTLPVGGPRHTHFRCGAILAIAWILLSREHWEELPGPLSSGISPAMKLFAASPVPLQAEVIFALAGI